MAPFLTHLVVGERLWTAMDLEAMWGDHYGTFLFGCLAPDVDKFCDGLSQGTTHFLPKDSGFRWVELRTRRFLDHQDEILGGPFCTLDPTEQAFVTGYLCHVATDEVTGRMFRSVRSAAPSILPPGLVDAILTALDPRVWTLARNPDEIVTGLESAAIPGDAIPFLPGGSLAAMHRIIWPQVQAGGGMVPYLDMVRRHRQWRQHGRVSDDHQDSEIEAALSKHKQTMETVMPMALELIELIDRAAFVQQAVEHSHERVAELLGD